MTDATSLRRAIRGANALRGAAYAALHEGRSRAAAEMNIALHRLEVTIVEEIRRRPETAKQIGCAALPYLDIWPEQRALPWQKFGRLPIADLEFLFDLNWKLLPRTDGNMERLRRIAARLEAI